MKLQSAIKRRSLRINVSLSGCSILQFLFKTQVNLLEFTFKIQLKHSGDDLWFIIIILNSCGVYV